MSNYDLLQEAQALTSKLRSALAELNAGKMPIDKPDKTLGNAAAMIDRLAIALAAAERKQPQLDPALATIAGAYIANPPRPDMYRAELAEHARALYEALL